MISEDSPAAITAAGTSSPSSSKGDAVAAVVAGDTLRVLDGAHSPRAVEDVNLSTTKNDGAIPKHMSSKVALSSVRRGPTRRTPQRRSSMKKPAPGCRHKPPRRAVSFNSKGPELHSIVSVEELLDYQQDALQKIWYEQDELDAAKESDFRLVANSTTAKDDNITAADSKEQQDGANEEEETLRGLENQTPEGSMESFMNRANAWDAVLRASFSTLDEDLAQLAEQATQRAKTTAHQRALQDQKEVLAYLKQEDQSCTATKGVTTDQDAAEGVRNSSSSLSAHSSLSSTTKGAEGGNADLSGETKDSCKAASPRVESFPLSDSLASLTQEELWENTENDKEARSKSLVQTEEDESLKLTSVTTPKSRTEHNDEANPKIIFRPKPEPEPVPDSPSRAGEDNTTETVSPPKQTNTQVSQVCPKISSSLKQGASNIPSLGNASFKEGKDGVIAPHSPFGRKGVPRLPVPCPPVRSKLHLATQEVPPGVDKDRSTRKGLPPPSMDWGSFRLPKKSNSKSTSKNGSKWHLLPNKSNSNSGSKQLPAKLSTESESNRKDAVEESKSPSRNRVLATAPDESELSTTTAVVSNTSCNRSDTSDTAKTETSAPKSEGRRVSIKDMRKRFENNAVDQPSVKDSRRGPPSYKWRKPSAIDLAEPEVDNSSQKASISDKRRGPPVYKWRKPSVVDFGPTLPKTRKEHEKGRVANKVAKPELRHTGTAANVPGHILPKEEQETHEQTRPRGASMALISLPVVSHKRQSPQTTSKKEVDRSQQILPGTRPVDTIVSPPTSSHRKSPVPADTVSNSVVSKTIQDFRGSIKSTDAVIMAVQSTAEAATKVSDASEVLEVLSPMNEVIDSYETSKKDPAIGDPPTSCTSIDAMIAAMQSAAAAANVAADAATSIANLVAGWKASNRSTSTMDPLAMAASAAATAAAAAATASAAAASAAAAAIEATKSVDAGSPVSLPATQRIVQDQDKDIEWSPTSKDGAPRAQKTRYLLVDSSVAKPPPQTRMTTSRNSPATSRGRNCNYRMPRNTRRSKSPYKEYKRPAKLPDRLPLQVHGKDAGDSTVQLVNKDCPTSRTSKPPKSKRRLGSPQVAVANKDCPASPKVASESKKCPASPTATTKNNDSCGSPKSAFKSAVMAFELQSKSRISSQVSRRAMNSSKVEDPVPRRSLEEKKTRPSLEKRQSTRFFATSGKVAAVMRKFSPNLVPSRRVF